MANKNILVISAFFYMCLLGLASIYSMEDFNNKAQKKEIEKIRIHIDYLNISFGEVFERLPLEMSNKILDYVFNDFYINELKNSKKIEMLIKINNLKSINKAFFVFLISNYDEKFKNISKILGEELIKIAMKEAGSQVFENFNGEDNNIVKQIFNQKDIDDSISLMKAGASLKERNYLGTALIWASWKGHKELVSELIKENVDLNEVDWEGDTALSCACYKGYKEIAIGLIKAGANIDMKNNWGNTALIWVCSKGFIDIARELINANVDLDLQDDWGKSALNFAVIKDFKNIVELLIEAKADLNNQNYSGNTALIIAADKGHKEIVELLINFYANLNLKNKKGKTALDLAKTEEIKKIINEAIKKQNKNEDDKKRKRGDKEDLELNKKSKKDDKDKGTGKKK